MAAGAGGGAGRYLLASSSAVIAGADCQPAWRYYFLAALYRSSGICGHGYRIISGPCPAPASRKQADKRRGAGRVSGRADGDYRQSQGNVVLYWHPARIF